MDACKFKAIKKFHDFEVSYSFTERQLLQWLSQLSIMDRFSTCVKLLSALQALKDVDLDGETRLKHLTLIKTYVAELFKVMETVFVDSSFPLNNKEKTNSELLAWINAEIAANYQKVVMGNSSPALDAEKQAFALNKALKHQGKCLLHIAQVYQAPFDGLWLNCYQIYQFAEHNQLLDIEVEQESAEASTINNTFKQIMLFNLSGSNQYRPREMYKIYDILGYYSHLSDITEDGWDCPRNECYFCFDQDLEPKIRRDQLETEDTDTANVYHISSTNVALQIYNNYVKDSSVSQGTLNVINNALMIRLVKSLGLNQTRKFTRMQQTKICKGIVGFDNLVNYIHGEKSLDVETGESYDPRIAGHWSTPDFPMVEQGEEWMQQKTYLYNKELKYKHDSQSAKVKKILSTAQRVNPELWQQSTESEEKPPADEYIGNFEILDGSIRGYGILWRERSLKVKIGEVFGLIDEVDNGLEIGVIRSINISNTDELRLGIEVIGLESNYVQMFMPGIEKSSTGAILVTSELGAKPEQSVVYSNSNFQTGEFVEIKQKNKVISCRLSRLLHSTPAFSHVELYFT